MGGEYLTPGIVEPGVSSLPEGWRVVRLGEVCSVYPGGRLGLTKANHYTASGYAAFSAAGQDGYVERAEFRDTEGVVLSSIGANCGRCFLATRSWTTLANTQAILPGRDLDPRYLFQRVDSVDYWPRSGSAQPFIKPSSIRECWLLLPPLPEQRRIAEILDTLDATIRKTEELIAKLRQAKKGLVHDLLTRGLDENSELRDPARHPEQFKDSELGRIPRGWGVATLGSMADSITSGSRGWARYYSEAGPLFVRIANLTREHINLDLGSVVHVRPPMGMEGQRTLLQTGDVLISITADLGIIGVIPADFGEAYVNQHIALVRLDSSKARSRWAGHYLHSSEGQWQFRESNDQGAKAGLNLPTIAATLVPLPPLPEQDQIVAQIDELDERVEIELAETEKLRTLKTGLMDDLLTGRVRVPVPEAST